MFNIFNKFPHFRQLDEMDCGPTCLRIISKYYGKEFSLDFFRNLSSTTRAGSSLLGLSEAAEKTGFRALGLKIGFDDLKEEQPFPCIAYWYQQHFAVLYKIEGGKVYVSDPGHGRIVYTENEFLKGWASNTNNEGIILTIDPTPDFYSKELEDISSKRGFKFIAKYLNRYQYMMFQLFLGLIIGSFLQLLFPFLTQNIVDIGIKQHNLSFIYLVLFGQLLLFFGRMTLDLLRNEILMHLSSRINIHLLTDFFIKLMKLPLSFFDIKMTGDILQRIGDHQRIEMFLTSGTLNVIFSSLNLLVLGGVLGYYSTLILGVFIIGSLLYFGWIMFFLKKRAELDYKKFTQLSINQDKNLEMIHGMQEIKLHNAERQKRWEWEHQQVKLYKLNIKGLGVQQKQAIGSSLINELKNIFITVLAAKLVLDGQISLGMMLSVTYIIGQLNAPILELVEFIRLFQDAKISSERINEIHSKPNEENFIELKADEVPLHGDIGLKNVSFKYISHDRSPMILSNLSLTIPAQKITAIVGASGSGKTTLLKLLLKFYEPNFGDISVDNIPLMNIYHNAWRDACGTVMQEGYIFSDSISGNIALGEEIIDKKKLMYAAKVANIHDFIESIPLRYNTKIGQGGIGLSTGQKQRILIARAVYKNPSFIFFDEATSALDATNERIIMDNLETFFAGRTVVVIAHRLSTVKNADQIIVLDKGEIVEIGSHNELVYQRGAYFNLIKNQLELGQ